ncbi:MAG: Tim44 domain-containing protein [Magnetococcales bacterium]|nr:Tim44 domain-containing protein [Magnetococcales bacterium]
MKRNRLFALVGIFITLLFSALIVMPESAEARRFGGGKSFGSRGSRSFSTPQKTTNRNATAAQRNKTSKKGSMMGGFMGAIGGFMLGGLLGAMLFGGDGGFGFLDLLLIAAIAFFAFKWWKSRQRGASSPSFPRPQQQGQPSSAGQSGSHPPMSFDQNDERRQFRIGGDTQQREGVTGGQTSSAQQGEGGSGAFDPSASSRSAVEAGIQQIAATDPSFSEASFLEGAKVAYERIQTAWTRGDMDTLRPLLTERMIDMVEEQILASVQADETNTVENIRFEAMEITEAWQEAGQDYVTTGFRVSMIEVTTDSSGNVIEGDPNVPQQIEEYWTFTRGSGATDPNWWLAAVQQPDEVASSSR